jgi:hypothetical protein
MRFIKLYFFLCVLKCILEKVVVALFFYFFIVKGFDLSFCSKQLATVIRTPIATPTVVFGHYFFRQRRNQLNGGRKRGTVEFQPVLVTPSFCSDYICMVSLVGTILLQTNVLQLQLQLQEASCFMFFFHFSLVSSTTFHNSLPTQIVHVSLSQNLSGTSVFTISSPPVAGGAMSNVFNPVDIDTYSSSVISS